MPHAPDRMLLHHMDSATPGGITGSHPGCWHLLRALLLLATHLAAFLAGVLAARGAL